jgi:hypothetical protein
LANWSNSLSSGGGGGGTGALALYTALEQLQRFNQGDIGPGACLSDWQQPTTETAYYAFNTPDLIINPVAVDLEAVANATAMYSLLGSEYRFRVLVLGSAIIGWLVVFPLLICLIVVLLNKRRSFSLRRKRSRVHELEQSVHGIRAADSSSKGDDRRRQRDRPDAQQLLSSNLENPTARRKQARDDNLRQSRSDWSDENIVIETDSEASLDQQHYDETPVSLGMSKINTQKAFTTTGGTNNSGGGSFPGSQRMTTEQWNTKNGTMTRAQAKQYMSQLQSPRNEGL